MRGVRRAAALGGIAATMTVVSAGPAHAERYLSKFDAESSAKDFVSEYYTDTYYSDLTAYCLPRGSSYDPDYDYRRWRCGWYDSSDDTRGVVQITGRAGSGNYIGTVLVRAH
jgi:hypothetical protein